jgi:hypothetical protein
MDRETLSDASFEALLRVADRYGVDVPEDASRDELEDLVIEAAEEFREEHRRANNHHVRIEESKYDIQLDGALQRVSSQEDMDLPDSYNETRVVLMLRDPSWAFAYWDIQESERSEFRRSDEFEGLLLRVYSLEEPGQSIETCRTSFDIPISVVDNRWYINLPEQQSHYRLSLVAAIHGGERILALSNVISVPRGSLSDRHASGLNGHAGEEILAQTGIQDLDLPANGKRIPQRILDLIDEDLVFN